MDGSDLNTAKKFGVYNESDTDGTARRGAGLSWVWIALAIVAVIILAIILF